jgi:hypothetical protein
MRMMEKLKSTVHACFAAFYLYEPGFPVSLPGIIRKKILPAIYLSGQINYCMRQSAAAAVKI